MILIRYSPHTAQARYLHLYRPEHSCMPMVGPCCSHAYAPPLTERPLVGTTLCLNMGLAAPATSMTRVFW